MKAGVATAALLIAVPASAEPAVDASRAMVGLFDAICIAHANDVAGARAAMAKRGIAPMPAKTARTLLVRPGEVFAVPVPAEHLALLSFDNGMCGTVAQEVDGGVLLLELQQDMSRRGIAVAAMGEAPSGAGQAYRLTGPGVRLELMVDIEKTEGGRQASMLAAPLAEAGR